MKVSATTIVRPALPRRPSLQAILLLGGTLLLSTWIVGCENFSMGDSLPTLTDEAPLSIAVYNALSRSPEVGLFSIDVKSLDGDTVRLSGFVDNDGQRVAAESIASQVEGVKSVVNTLYLN